MMKSICIVVALFAAVNAAELFVGRGFDGSGRYDLNYALGQIFEPPKINLEPNGESSQESYLYESDQEWVDSLSVGARIGVSFGLWGLEVAARYSEQHRRTVSHQYFSVVRRGLPVRHVLDVDRSPFSSFFNASLASLPAGFTVDPVFLANCTSIADARCDPAKFSPQLKSVLKFLSRWGTHYIRTVLFGAQLRFTSSSTQTTISTSQSFGAAAKANFMFITAQVDASWHRTYTEYINTTQRSIEIHGSDDNLKNRYLNAVGPACDQSSNNTILAYQALGMSFNDSTNPAAFWLDSIFHLLPEPLRTDLQPVTNVFLGSPVQERLDKNKKRLAAIMARMNLHCFDDNVDDFRSCSSVEDATDRKGSQYASIPTDTAQECALKCTRDSRCEAWTWWNRQCSLKNNVPDGTTDHNCISGVNVFNVFDKWAAQPVEGFTNEGRNLGPSINLPNAAECAKNCSAQVACLAWVYEPNTRLCSKKSNVGEHREDTRFVTQQKILADGVYRYSATDAVQARALLTENRDLVAYLDAYRLAIRALI